MFILKHLVAQSDECVVLMFLTIKARPLSNHHTNMNLPPKIQQQVEQWASSQGFSTEQFIAQAVAEKIAALTQGGVSWKLLVGAIALFLSCNQGVRLPNPFNSQLLA